MHKGIHTHTHSLSHTQLNRFKKLEVKKSDISLWTYSQLFLLFCSMGQMDVLTLNHIEVRPQWTGLVLTMWPFWLTKSLTDLCHALVGACLLKCDSSSVSYFRVHGQELSSPVRLLGSLGRRSDIMGTTSVFSLMTHLRMSKKFCCFWSKRSELFHLSSIFIWKNSIPSMRSYLAKIEAEQR